MATLVGTPVLTEGTFSTDKTATLPAGIQAGDVIFCVWVTANEHTIGSLGDFTQIGTTETSSLESMTVAYKVAEGDEGASITFTGLFTATESGSTLAFAYRGLNTADLIEAVAQANLAAIGTSVSGPSVTPVNNGCLILQINGVDPGAAVITMTPDASGTSIFNGQDDGDFSYYGVQSFTQATAEAVALDATFDISSQYITFQVALNQASTPSIRKSGSATFDKPSGIGTITGVTLDGNAITLDSQDATTFTVTDSDESITTSGEYDLVATGDAVETISVQVNVYGVAPSNNPLQKDGAAQASLTNVQLRISAGTTLAGTQLFYTGTATTNASGNLGNIDLSDTAAADEDAVLLSIRTAAGYSIITTETVGLI